MIVLKLILSWYQFDTPECTYWFNGLTNTLKSIISEIQDFFLVLYNINTYIVSFRINKHLKIFLNFQAKTKAKELFQSSQTPLPKGKYIRKSGKCTLVSRSICNHSPKLLNSNGLIDVTPESIIG